MSIALLGGPLDGAISEGLSHMPIYLVASNSHSRPIYKRIGGLSCPHMPVPYIFIGYEGSPDIQDLELIQSDRCHDSFDLNDEPWSA